MVANWYSLEIGGTQSLQAPVLSSWPRFDFKAGGDPNAVKGESKYVSTVMLYYSAVCTLIITHIVCLCVSLSIYIYIYIYVCLYMCIYTYIYIYIYIYIGK